MSSAELTHALVCTVRGRSQKGHDALPGDAIELRYPLGAEALLPKRPCLTCPEPVADVV